MDYFPHPKFGRDTFLLDAHRSKPLLDDQPLHDSTFQKPRESHVQQRVAHLPNKRMGGQKTSIGMNLYTVYEFNLAIYLHDIQVGAL